MTTKTFCDFCGVQKASSGSEYISPYIWVKIKVINSARDERPTTEREFCGANCTILWLKAQLENDDAHGGRHPWENTEDYYVIARKK